MGIIFARRQRCHPRHRADNQRCRGFVCDIIKTLRQNKSSVFVKAYPFSIFSQAPRDIFAQKKSRPFIKKGSSCLSFGKKAF